MNRIVILTISILFLITLPSHMQPNWVEEVVSASNTISASKEASAIILHELAEAEVSKNGTVETYRQLVTKFLKSEGEEFGTLALPASPFHEINNLKGWVIHPDGIRQTLPKENIVKMGFQESHGYYDDAYTLIANLPKVQPGDITAFEWTEKEKGWKSLYHSFIFQIQQPVKFTRFSVRIPKNWQLLKAEWQTDGIQFERLKNRFVWTGYNLEFQPDEPLSPAWYFLSRRIAISCFDPGNKGIKNFSDWSAVSRWFGNLYAPPSVPTTAIKIETNKLIGGLSSLEEKLRSIANFVQEDVRYVAVEIGKERWEPRDAYRTLNNRYGDCKDKTTLMRAMLRSAGIPSVPVLASTKYPVDSQLPTPFQFDHCIVAIPLEKREISSKFENAMFDDWLFFDPTDPATPIGVLPWSLQGAKVLLGAEVDSALCQLPYPDPQDFRRVNRATVYLNRDGSGTADIIVKAFGGFTSHARYLNQTTSPKEQMEKWHDVMNETTPNVTLANYKIKDYGDSIYVSFTITGNRLIEKVGEFYLLRPDIFHSSEPPKLTAEARHHPIWFGEPMEIETRIEWHLPEGWRTESDTLIIENSCRVTSILCKMILDGNRFQYYSRQCQNGGLIWPEEYESTRKFSRDLSIIRGQTIVFSDQ
jgi:predicted transglutaminase-like cysteine proteinase